MGRSVCHIGYINETLHSFLDPTSEEVGHFTAHAWKMENGYCSIMTDRIGEYTNCKPILYFSNPEVKYKDVQTGKFYANNALWIRSQRWAISTIGHERNAVNCDENNFVYSEELLHDLIESKEKNVNLSYLFPYEPIWQ